MMPRKARLNPNARGWKILMNDERQHVVRLSMSQMTARGQEK